MRAFEPFNWLNGSTVFGQTVHGPVVRIVRVGHVAYAAGGLS
jgi:hypothetical protein